MVSTFPLFRIVVHEGIGEIVQLDERAGEHSNCAGVTVYKVLKVSKARPGQ